MTNEKIDEFFEQRKLGNPISNWETFKIEVKMLTSEYAIVKAQSKNRLLELLEHKLSKLDKKLRDTKEEDQRRKILKDINRMEEFIQDEHEVKTKQIMFRSRCRYYLEGERNTKYFMQLEKVRSNSRCIAALKSEERIIINDPQLIMKEQQKFFQKLYKKGVDGHIEALNETRPQISEQEKNDLDKELTLVELSNAVKQMENDKTPGHDGIPVEFYKVFWERISQPLYKAIQKCERQEILYSSALRGVITLIPKKERDLLFLQNWHPISLLNVDYKIISKALALRMKGKLPFLIHEDQTGFMQGRNISHNLRKILDIIQIAEKKSIAAIIVSVDAEKCFDRWAWGAIDDALKYFNFGPAFRAKVRMLFKGLTTCVINNGHVSQFFSMERGIPQGSGISPYLQLIVTEILAIRLRANRNIKGITVDDLEFKTALFADDLNMFLQFDKVTLMEVTKEIDQFGTETGFKVNYDKTSISRIGSLKDSNAQIYTSKPFRWTNSPPKILGITVCTDISKMRQDNYNCVLKKVEHISKIWANRNLSIMGKNVVINS